MTTVKRFEVGDTKCLDDGSRDQALLIGCPNRTIISLVFDNEKATHAQVHELDRLLGKMGLTGVEVQTEEPRHVVRAIRRRARPRPGRGSLWGY
jgi:hypothetical protein